MKKLEDLILTYKDFPKKGIDFKDVLEILQYPEIFHDLILKMSSNEFLKNAEAIISIDARGFIFGSAVALQLSKPMIVARKPGKLPGDILTREYDLEYGKNSLSIQSNALKKFNSFVIVDDLLATGGTVNCVSRMLQDQRKEILGLITVIELNKLKNIFSHSGRNGERNTSAKNGKRKWRRNRGRFWAARMEASCAHCVSKKWIPLTWLSCLVLVAIRF